jgi:hypothetical protein
LKPPPRTSTASRSSKNKAQATNTSNTTSNLAVNSTPGGGSGVLANRKNFPALINLSVAASIDFMNPCCMKTPHIDPRATEFLTIAQGGNVKTGFIMEEGLNTELTTVLDQYQGAIFPQRSIRYEFNDNCEPAVFTAEFSSDDPGLSCVAQNFFSLNPDIVDADLAFLDVLDQTNIARLASSIPSVFAFGAKECLDRCGIKY